MLLVYFVMDFKLMGFYFLLLFLINESGSHLEKFLNPPSLSEPGKTDNFIWIRLALLYQGIFSHMKREDNGP